MKRLPRRERMVEEPLVARYWSPAQLMAPVIGTVFLLWGFASLGHSGFHSEHVFEPHDTLLGFHYTPLMAATEIGFGVVMLVAGLLLRLGRGRMRTVDSLAVGLGSTAVTLASGAALALGLTVLADGWTVELRHWLGIGRPEAWVCVTVGVVGLFAAVASPVVLAPAPRPAGAEPGARLDEPVEPAPSSSADLEQAAGEETDVDSPDPTGRSAERREFTVG